VGPARLASTVARRSGVELPDSGPETRACPGAAGRSLMPPRAQQGCPECPHTRSRNV
jgi:hypothetical protein